MDLNLSGRHAIVCGASAGIGRATAIELAQLGARVTAVSRSAAKLDGLLAALPAREGQRHGRVAVDVNDSERFSEVLTALCETSPAHILINNTGGPPGGAAHSASIDAYLAAFHQHLVANQLALQAVLPGMRAAKWGRVVNVISTSVYEPIAGLGVSNTVRAAVAGWSKTVSNEVAAAGITVNNVLPGYTRTGRLDGLIEAKSAQSGDSADAIANTMLSHVPAARFAEPEETAALIAFLCSPSAAYITGQSIAVDGGRMHKI